MHLHRSAWAFSWERRAGSPALPAKALTQQVLRKCTRAAWVQGGLPPPAWWDEPVCG